MTANHPEDGPAMRALRAKLDRIPGWEEAVNEIIANAPPISEEAAMRIAELLVHGAAAA